MCWICLRLLGLMMSSCVHVVLACGHLAAALNEKLQHMQLIVHVFKGLGLDTHQKLICQIYALQTCMLC